MRPDIVFRGQNVVLDDAIKPAAVHVWAGMITDVTAYEEAPSGVPIIDAGELVIMPGLVDCHVHVNEPGRTEWEGFETATRAAASGGVTTLVDMPLNSIPPTTTPAALGAKIEAARDRVSVDVGFWGGVVPGNSRDLAPLVDAGVLGFKCFLIDSGVAEFPPVDEAELRKSLGLLGEIGAVLLVHAELEGPVAAAARTLPSKGLDRKNYLYHLESRPKAAENEAIELMLRLCREYKNRIHIVHHSSSEALPLLDQARQEGLPLSVETCPHYLCFSAEEIPAGATHFKCTPPIREAENQEALWKAVASGVIDAVVSDHSPCSPALKRLDQGDFEEAWGGISSLGLTLSATWAEAAARGHSLLEVARWMARAPAVIAGLAHRKGRIARGFDADLVFFSPDERFVVHPEALESRHHLTPYESRALRGVVEVTYLRGKEIYSRPLGTKAYPPLGRLLFGDRR
jgi:allantoinase